jgi:hypothetical protein
MCGKPDSTETRGLTAAENMKRTDSNAPDGNYTGPLIIQKRIGTTNYEVSVYFNMASKESLEDKILRLALKETLNLKANT